VRVHVTSTAVVPPQYKVSVLVDVLRSSSTIIIALDNGARRIIPFTNIRDALRFRRTVRRQDVVLVGERHGVAPEHFNYNISPLDMTRENIEGKVIAYSSTNLTRVLGKIRGKTMILVGGVINANATANYLRSLRRDVVIIACGTMLGPTVEDLAGAGAIASQLGNEDLSDEALVAVGLYRDPHWRDLAKRGRTAGHLKRLGFERDIDFCLSKPNLSAVVPGLVENTIVDVA
jgi:2-phosphosulfolactate phosphatase